jgi:hypothetical protein
MPVSESPRNRADAATAGGLLIGAIVSVAGASFGVGALVGLAVPLGLVGFFAGVVVGVLLVHARYRRV